MVREYTDKQIKNAKENYNRFLKFETANNYEVSVIGMQEAERRAENHNKIVSAILNGDKALEKKWKIFFLDEELKADAKKEASKRKLNENKEASADILEPVKKLRKLGEFGKWLNTAGNPYRKQHFSKKYTAEAVEEFLKTL